MYDSCRNNFAFAALLPAGTDLKSEYPKVAAWHAKLTALPYVSHVTFPFRENFLIYSRLDRLSLRRLRRMVLASKELIMWCCATVYTRHCNLHTAKPYFAVEFTFSRLLRHRPLG